MESDVRISLCAENRWSKFDEIVMGCAVCITLYFDSHSLDSALPRYALLVLIQWRSELWVYDDGWSICDLCALQSQLEDCLDFGTKTQRSLAALQLLCRALSSCASRELIQLWYSLRDYDDERCVCVLCALKNQLKDDVCFQLTVFTCICWRPL